MKTIVFENERFTVQRWSTGKWEYFDRETGDYHWWSPRLSIPLAG